MNASIGALSSMPKLDANDFRLRGTDRSKIASGPVCLGGTSDKIHQNLLDEPTAGEVQYADRELKSASPQRESAGRLTGDKMA
jgi:hypothetical protein